MNFIDHKNKIIRKIAKTTFCCIIFFIFSSKVQAIILYSGDNSANLTTPDTARTDIFNSVARISNSDGTGIIGSAVHIKGKYLLTAEHVLYRNVTPRSTHVSFDGTSYWAIDSNFLPIVIQKDIDNNIENGVEDADLVLFKLIEDPNLPDTQLYSSTNEFNKTATLIGFGYGRDPNQGDFTEANRRWDWGSGANAKKRWGTNKIDLYGNLSYTDYRNVTFKFSYLHISELPISNNLLRSE